MKKGKDQRVTILKSGGEKNQSEKERGEESGGKRMTWHRRSRLPCNKFNELDSQEFYN